MLQPYDMEVGAGTFHPATTLRSLGPKPWKAAYVQPSRRPKDGRYGENPNRLQHYYQFQVILKPSPENLQELYLDSLAAIGVDMALHDVRFVEDDWESPTLGAWGLGWECWCDGMEVSQFTYFQQVAGFECAPVSGELTYGLERLAMYVQGVECDLRHQFQRPRRRGARSPTATCSCRPSRNIRATISSTPTPRCCSSISRTRRPSAASLLEKGDGGDAPSAGAAGLRSMHQGEPRLQPARRARRDLGDGAAELHPARARTGQGLRRGLVEDGGRRGVTSADDATRDQSAQSTRSRRDSRGVALGAAGHGQRYRASTTIPTSRRSTFTSAMPSTQGHPESRGSKIGWRDCLTRAWRTSTIAVSLSVSSAPTGSTRRRGRAERTPEAERLDGDASRQYCCSLQSACSTSTVRQTQRRGERSRPPTTPCSTVVRRFAQSSLLRADDCIVDAYRRVYRALDHRQCARCH